MDPQARVAELLDTLPDHRRWADDTAGWDQVAAWQVARAAAAAGLDAAVGTCGPGGAHVAVVDGLVVDFDGTDRPSLAPAPDGDQLEPVRLGQLPRPLAVRTRLARLENRR